MVAKDVMTKGAKCVDPSNSLQEAAQKMKTLDVGALPVRENDRIVGTIAHRDIAVRAVAEACDPHTTTVKDVMLWCFDDKDVQEAARLLREN